MIWLLLAVPGVALFLVACHAVFGIRSQWLGRTDWHGRPESGGVALTFDDGPTVETGPILDALAERGAAATFFCVGRQVELFPDIARRIVAEGHEIGNHSYSHPMFLYKSRAETMKELERTQNLIAAVTGVRPNLARPPYGVRTPAFFKAARKLGLRTVQWDVAGFDWKGLTAAEIASRVLRKVKPGSIILLHDGDGGGSRTRVETTKAVRRIIAGLASRELEIKPLGEMLPDIAN